MNNIKKQRKKIWFFLIIFLFIPSSILFLWLGYNWGPMYAFLAIPLLIIFIIIIYLAFIPKKIIDFSNKKKLEARQRLINQNINKILPNFECYHPDQFFNCENIMFWDARGLVNYITEGKDYLCGTTPNNLHFSYCTNKIVKYDLDKEKTTYFDGMLLSTTSNFINNDTNPVIIHSKNLQNDWLYTKFGNKIETENAEFNNLFSSYCPNMERFFYILTPQFIEYLINLQNKIPEFALYIKDDGAIIISIHGFDLFEPAYMNKQFNDKKLAQINNNLNILMNILDDISSYSLKTLLNPESNKINFSEYVLKGAYEKQSVKLSKAIPVLLFISISLGLLFGTPLHYLVESYSKNNPEYINVTYKDQQTFENYLTERYPNHNFIYLNNYSGTVNDNGRMEVKYKDENNVTFEIEANKNYKLEINNIQDSYQTVQYENFIKTSIENLQFPYISADDSNLANRCTDKLYSSFDNFLNTESVNIYLNYIEAPGGALDMQTAIDIANKIQNQLYIKNGCIEIKDKYNKAFSKRYNCETFISFNFSISESNLKYIEF